MDSPTSEPSPSPGSSPTSSAAWIDDLTDEQCMEIFWLYVDPPEPFLESHPPELLGMAMRYALKQVLAHYAQPG